MIEDSERPPREGTEDADRRNAVEKAVEEIKRAEADLARARELEERAKAVLRDAEKELERAEHDCFEFFVGKVRYETRHEVLTGAQIKAIVSNWPAGYGLELERHGDEPDRLIADNESVRFHYRHPLHFTPVPPATFGGGGRDGVAV